MTVPKLTHLPWAVAASVVCLSAHAGGYTSTDGKFQLSGFGTLGAVVTDTDDEDVKFAYAGRPNGAATKPSLDPDSKVALQGTYKFTPTVSLTSQLLTKYGTDASYTPNIEWAFAKWQVLPSVAVRIGRTGAPLFMISDFRDVGYANSFVRPPAEVYDQVPFSTVDGGDITVQQAFGPVILTGQLWSGTSSNLFPAATLDVKKLLGMNLIAEIDGGFTLRVGHVAGKINYSGPSLIALSAGASSAQGMLNQYAGTLSGGAAAAVAGYANEYGAASALATINSVDASFDGIGISIDRDNWVGSLEFTKRKSDSLIADSTGWYANIGYRFGSLTPFIGVSKLKVDRLDVNPISAAADSTLAGVASGGGATSDQLADLAAIRPGVSTALQGQDIGQSTSSIGIRWDAHSGLAVKAQVDRIKSNGYAGLFNVSSGHAAVSKAINVLTVSVDFVF